MYKRQVLEIGAGCGAVTGGLAEKAKSVDCIELSKKRSMINAFRHKNLDNIKITVGNFEEIEIEKKYDVVTLIGVLEYAESYIHSANPYDDFLKRVFSMLKPGGRLYIAIENKLGIKYFAGCREDHLGEEFVGIEGYEKKQGVRTFTYSELRNMAVKSGFSEIKFYYPFPDYKIPTEIY